MQPVRYLGMNVTGHQRSSQPLWWEEMKWYEAEGAKQYGSKQEDSEGSEESKRGLGRYSVYRDRNLPEQKQQ